jgi:hypothetical protein
MFCSLSVLFISPFVVFSSHLTPLQLNFFFSNTTACPYRLRSSPSWLWPMCNRLLRLGSQLDAIMLPRWSEWWYVLAWSTRRGLKTKFYRIHRLWSLWESSPERKNPHGRTGNRSSYHQATRLVFATEGTYIHLQHVRPSELNTTAEVIEETPRSINCLVVPGGNYTMFELLVYWLITVISGACKVYNSNESTVSWVTAWRRRVWTSPLPVNNFAASQFWSSIDVYPV